MHRIEIRGLTKRFGSYTAVDQLDLQIEAGECLALLGMNGAGKTTVIRMLSCQLRPDAGDAVILGHSIAAEPARVKSLVALSPQETAVAPNLTVRENLELIAGICGAGKARAAGLAEEMLLRLHMQEVEKKRAGRLSGGWQRRLSIAMALIQQPKLLFLDEPTLGLDVLARRELWNVVKQLKGEVTILLTTHYLEEAVALCDRIAILNRGRLKALGTAEELKKLTNCDSFEDAFAQLAVKEDEV